MNPTQIYSVIYDFKTEYPDLDYLANLKTGKEADVFLVNSGQKLMALKIYRENTKFSTRLKYIDTSGMKAREKKAIKQHSKRGTQMTQKLWTNKEFSFMQRLYRAGAFVPQPLAYTTNALLMEYIGDLEAPAPRLIDYQMQKENAQEIFEKLLYSLQIIVRSNYVHGDLSPYNILVWEKTPFIIDFPQMIELQNKGTYELLKKDISNIYEYFSKFLLREKLEALWDLYYA